SAEYEAANTAALLRDLVERMREVAKHGATTAEFDVVYMQATYSRLQNADPARGGADIVADARAAMLRPGAADSDAHRLGKRARVEHLGAQKLSKAGATASALDVLDAALRDLSGARETLPALRTLAADCTRSLDDYERCFELLTAARADVAALPEGARDLRL